jgi:hypothetical protein
VLAVVRVPGYQIAVGLVNGHEFGRSRRLSGLIDCPYAQRYGPNIAKNH